MQTCHLAEQQYNAFKSAFSENWNAIGKTIDKKCDAYRIAQHFEAYTILFVTAKKLVNAIEQKRIKNFDYR